MQVHFTNKYTRCKVQDCIEKIYKSFLYEIYSYDTIQQLQQQLDCFCKYLYNKYDKKIHPKCFIDHGFDINQNPYCTIIPNDDLKEILNEYIIL